MRSVLLATAAVLCLSSTADAARFMMHTQTQCVWSVFGWCPIESIFGTILLVLVIGAIGLGIRLMFKNGFWKWFRGVE